MGRQGKMYAQFQDRFDEYGMYKRIQLKIRNCLIFLWKR